MSGYEIQVVKTGQCYDQLMREIERKDSNILSSAVTDSRLHEKIHNPVTKCIDEG